MGSVPTETVIRGNGRSLPDAPGSSPDALPRPAGDVRALDIRLCFDHAAGRETARTDGSGSVGRFKAFALRGALRDSGSMTVILLNPNTSVETTDRMCRLAARVMPERPVGWSAPTGPDVIVTAAALDRAAQLVAAAQVPPTARAAIVAAFGDPGLIALQNRLSIPVIGIGAASARAASATGMDFAVVTTTPDLAPQIDALMRTAGDPSRYVGSYFTLGDPVAVMAETGTLDAALLAAIDVACDAGARCVIIGGGPLGEAAERLRDRSPLPLFNPVLCAAREAAMQLAAAHE